ncbi:hypothetical protein HRbin10_00307 [bacterium HR10]|nr:hypothetical protein HRbin10_00307 [bacterium HR10]
MRKLSVRLIMNLVITLMVLWPPAPPSGAVLTSLAQRCGGDFSVSNMERRVIGIGLQGTTYTQCVSVCSQEAYNWTTNECIPILPTGTDWVCYVILAFWEAGCVLICPFIP